MGSPAAPIHTMDCPQPSLPPSVFPSLSTTPPSAAAANHHPRPISTPPPITHLHEPWVQHLPAVVLGCEGQPSRPLQLSQLHSQGLQGPPPLSQMRWQLRLDI